MNISLPEMFNSSTDMTVLERQRARTKWNHRQIHQQHEHEACFAANEYNLLSMPAQLFQGPISGDSVLQQFVNRAIKTDPDFENEWENSGKFLVPGTGFLDENLGFEYCGYSWTNSFPREVAETSAAGRDSGSTEKKSFKKRKADKMQYSKIAAGDEISRDKIMKNCAEEGDSKITDTSKENSKVSDYIHVRARRGQATDSHSLAERVRREKISERMKYLQDLVPGCNKITGKAGMLDEIINYVQSLQRQIEFLSMKLATINSRDDLNIDNLFANYPTIGLSSEMATPNDSQFNSVQQLVSCGMEIAPLLTPDAFLKSSCLTQFQPTSSWVPELQNIFNLEVKQAGRSLSFSSQPFAGSKNERS